MIFVVDSNIVFSALLNPKSTVAELIFDVQNKFEFYSPELMGTEINRYSEKIAKYTKLDSRNLKIVRTSVFACIELISEELISKSSWQRALELTKDVDEDDTPFIALSLELNGRLWTGDKKLIDGISKKRDNLTITTKELEALRVR